MKFIGIDLGWRSQPSGLCCLESIDAQLQLLDLDRKEAIADILTWIDLRVQPDESAIIAHWCQLNVKTCLEPAFRLSRSQSPTGNAVLEAPPPLLAALPPGVAFPARGWKRGLKRVCA